MTQRHARLSLERLDGRILPSASPLGFVGPVAHSATASHSADQHALAGQGHGLYSYDAVQSGAGIEYRLDGLANLAGMGRVRVHGSVHSVGFVQSGQATGELTFSNAGGSVTVELVGPSQAGFSPLPGTFSYHVVAATGRYAGLTDSGTMSLALKTDPALPGTNPHGHFKMSI